MLSVRHVIKRYHKTVANEDVSFSVGDSEIGILLGLLLAPGIVVCALISVYCGPAALGTLCMGVINLALGACMIACCKSV